MMSRYSNARTITTKHRTQNMMRCIISGSNSRMLLRVSLHYSSRISRIEPLRYDTLLFALTVLIAIFFRLAMETYEYRLKLFLVTYSDCSCRIYQCMVPWDQLYGQNRRLTLGVVSKKTINATNTKIGTNVILYLYNRDQNVFSQNSGPLLRSKHAKWSLHSAQR